MSHGHISSFYIIFMPWILKISGILFKVSIGGRVQQTLILVITLELLDLELLGTF